jgi:Putative periplasminc binding protein (DUF178).
MKVLFPQNIFSSLLVETLPQELVNQISYIDSARLLSELNADNCDVALIPSLDLIKNKDLFVSKKVCIAFHGFICNSFVYFLPDQTELESLSVKGDVTAHDVILAKYLFSEMYNKEIKISLMANDDVSEKEKNILTIGDENISNLKLLGGLSISEEISEMISYPYVNFILVSKSGVSLAEFADKLPDLNNYFDENIEKIVNNLNQPQEIKEYLIDQSGALSFVVGENEENGINELLRLPYFYGMIDDIVEVKFV